MRSLLSAISRMSRAEQTRAKRRPADYYPTPQHAIQALLDAYPPPVGVPVIEPAAGDGAIVRELVARGYRVAAIEIRGQEEKNLRRAGAYEVVIGDWFEILTEIGPSGKRWWQPRPHSIAIVSNPPFSLARPFAESCLALEPIYCALLLRINVEASNPWHLFWLAHPWDKRIPLWKRPSFTGDGRTDGANYCWYIFTGDEHAKEEL